MKPILRLVLVSGLILGCGGSSETMMGTGGASGTGGTAGTGGDAGAMGGTGGSAAGADIEAALAAFCATAAECDEGISVSDCITNNDPGEVEPDCVESVADYYLCLSMLGCDDLENDNTGSCALLLLQCIPIPS